METAGGGRIFRWVVEQCPLLPLSLSPIHGPVVDGTHPTSLFKTVQQSRESANFAPQIKFKKTKVRSLSECVERWPSAYYYIIKEDDDLNENNRHPRSSDDDGYALFGYS